MGVKREYERASKSVTDRQYWKSVRFAVMRRDGFRCVRCGKRGRLEVDHIEPVRDRPDLAWSLDNLQSLCPQCHGFKTRQEIGIPERSPERKRWADLVRDLSCE